MKWYTEATVVDDARYLSLGIIPDEGGSSFSIIGFYSAVDIFKSKKLFIINDFK